MEPDSLNISVVEEEIEEDVDEDEVIPFDSVSVSETSRKHLKAEDIR
tara:strand:+ start:325 stop:465 length:141 start_codon:yes stop_codon:yes gene_type:complete